MHSLSHAMRSSADISSRAALRLARARLVTQYGIFDDAEIRGAKLGGAQALRGRKWLRHPLVGAMRDVGCDSIGLQEEVL